VLASNDDEGWQTVCQLPCDRQLDPSLEYRVAGAPWARFDRTDAFALPSGKSSLRLDADLASDKTRSAGFQLVAFGVPAIPTGLVIAIVAAMSAGHANPGPGSDPKVERAVAYGGLGLTGAGVVALATGIGLMLGNRTHVTMTSPDGPSVKFVSGVTMTPRGFVFLGARSVARVGRSLFGRAARADADGVGVLDADVHADAYDRVAAHAGALLAQRLHHVGVRGAVAGAEGLHEPDLFVGEGGVVGVQLDPAGVRDRARIAGRGGRAAAAGGADAERRERGEKGAVHRDGSLHGILSRSFDSWGEGGAGASSGGRGRDAGGERRRDSFSSGESNSALPRSSTAMVSSVATGLAPSEQLAPHPWADPRAL
jgi:hypothetical protein